jgi:hypothetical protein
MDESADTAPTGWPRTFFVGVDTLDGTRRGNLEIGPGSLVLQLNESIGRFSSAPDLMVHAAPKVEMYHARAPFWCKIGLLINDGHWSVVAAAMTFQRRRLRRALLEAGFQVSEHRTWLDVGKGAMRRP